MSRTDSTRGEFPRKFGTYHLLAPLAQGGMGALYLAVTGERGFERLLVIKTVLPHLADAEYVARFRDEAKVVVKLSHGNLIPVFDAGQVGGEIFLAMDFVEGKDLRAVWNRCAKKAVAFPVDVAAYVIKELCRGLAYAHSYGDLELVHRDISPPNILLSYSGEVKLTDFGLASSTLKLEKTAPGIIYGKVAYMSPEQARGDRLDGRSDIYAAGIILWELLTGRQLFPPGKEQPQDLLKRARDPDVPPPSQRAPRVPGELDDIVLKALAPDREHRYRDAEELRTALSGWLAQASPTTDESRMKGFLHQLFDEDIEKEREERQELINKVRDRIRRTLPPNHELRKMLEDAGGQIDLSAIEAAADRRVGDDGPNLGRRAEDRGGAADRRRGGRRAVDAAPGGAVKVPKAGPGGRTVVTPPPGRADSSGGAAAAATAEQEEEEAEGGADVIGEVLDGRYRILELIGEGGMGRVYLAEHVEIGKRVAVKILHVVYSRMPDLVERFRREARAASKIGHPHIVDVTDSGITEEGAVYFVMEYLEGAELASVIDREGAIDIARALRIATQVCRALAGAHAVGIIHRDLKPENVFLTVKEGTSDFVKVLDFGIAKSSEAEEARTQRLTHPGMAMGTPEYMSPEQAAGKAADQRCDIYAAGAILYEMLTGVPPYEGDNFMEILTKKATVDPAPARQLRPEIPEPVESLVMQALSRDPNARPTSMEAFDYELTKCLSGRGAAVAMVLGMKTDPLLVAGLNPGLPDEQVAAADSWEYNSTPPPRVRLRRTAAPSGSNPPTAAQSGAVVEAAASALSAAQHAAGQIAPSPEDALDEAIVSTANLPPPDFLQKKIKGTGARLVGVMALLAVLLGGGGLLFLSSRGEDAGAAGRGAADGISRTGESGGDEVDEPRGGERAERDQSGAEEQARGGGAARPDGARAEERGVARARPGGRRGPGRHDGPPRNSREAKTLLRKARAAKARTQWDRAEALYRRVASGRYQTRAGYLGLAEVAFEKKRFGDIIAYAKKAGSSTRALELIGNAHFRQGNYRRALKYYERVLERRPQHEGVRRAAEEARKRLGN